MLRAALLIVLTALTGIAGWWTYVVRDKVLGNEIELEQSQERIVELEGELDTSREEAVALGREVEEKKRRIQELEVRLTLLKIDHRVARIEVIDQQPDPQDPTRVETTIRFIEYDREGEPLNEGQEITLPGNKLYLETLVIKFGDEYVEAGEFLRGTSLCLFRRMFSEGLAPVDGVAIDEPGTHPHPYSGGDAEDELFHAELWRNFWDYANDPDKARQVGLRALQGEAPSIRLVQNKLYWIDLRASDGLTIKTMDRSPGGMSKQGPKKRVRQPGYSGPGHN